MNKKEKTALVPKLRFPEFVDSGVWSISKLGNISEPIEKRAGTKKYTLLSVTAGTGLVSQLEKFGREIAGNAYKNYYVIQQGDFAYNKSATKQFPEGYISMLTEYEEGAVPNSIFTCFSIIDNQYCPKIFDHIFKSNFHGIWLRKFISVGARAHGSLSIDDKYLWEMPIVLPLLPEQQKIADCLSSLDDLITAEDKKLSALKAHKKGLMQKLFPAEGKTMPEIRFEGYTDAWNQQKLGEVYKTYSGQTPLRSDASNFENPTTPWIKTTDLNNGKIFCNDEDISDSGVRDLKILPADTVLIAMYGGFNQIGRTGLLTYPATINQALTALEPNGKINAYFLITQLNHRVVEWKTVAASSRKDVNITKKDIEKFRLLSPSLQEQTIIGNFFCNLDGLITAQSKKIEALKVHKKGLMQGLFPSVDEVGA
ncbi:MAG: restriction endonuclease subunit S [Anaerovoracaceae bacterium]